MANKKTTAKKGPGIEALGWGFWLIIFFISLGPSVYLVRLNTYESDGWLTPALGGFILAAIVAGVVSWLANSALQLWLGYRQKGQQKKSKKKAS